MTTIFLLFVCFFPLCFCETVLIPRSEILGPDDHKSVSMSHDGKFVAYIGAAWDNELKGSSNIFVMTLPNGTPKRMTNDKTDSISYLQIVYDGKSILYLSDPDGDENFALSKLNIETGEIVVIVDDNNVRAMMWSMSPTKPNEILFGTNKRNPVYHDVYHFDLQRGEQKLVFENNYYKWMLFNYDLQPYIGYNETEDSSMKFYRILSDGQADLIKTSPAENRETTKPANVDDTGTVYFFDSDETDKVSFVAMDPKTKQRQVLYTGKRADITDAKFHPLTGRPLWLAEEYMKSERIPLDISFNSDFQCLESNIPGNPTLDVLDMSLDMKAWLVKAQYDNKFPNYYYYDRMKRTVQYLFSQKESMSKYSMGSTYPVEVKTSDGLVEVCYVTLPVDFDISKTGVPSKPLSTVIYVHGGPWGRDSWEFDNYAQMLVNRNYAVIRCNYRASTGFGKAFLNAGNGQWGLKMQQDLTDAVHWAVQQKISDPNKVAIAGYSYGGYATLAGLTFTPDLYACGVDIVGPSNLITLLNSIPEYWKTAFESLKLGIGGDPNTEEGREKLKRSSPFFSADKIKKPLLIGQGANDPRVKQAEADQIFNALKSSNIFVTYVLFSNEGHGFNHPENDIAFWAIAEKFLSECLGGRAEPIRDEIGKSTAKIQQNNASSPLLN